MPIANISRGKVSFTPPADWGKHPDCVWYTDDEAKRFDSRPPLSDPDFRGREVHVLGTGPSLANYRRDPLAVIIGVNGVPASIKCDYWLVCDRVDEAGRSLCDFMRAYAWSKPEGTKMILMRPAYMSALAGSPPEWQPDMTFDSTMFQTQPGDPMLFLAGASTHCAIDWARRGKARRIVLVGQDFNDHRHYYNRDAKLDADKLNNDEPFPGATRIMEGYRLLNDACLRDEVELVNASASSAIPYVPKAKASVTVQELDADVQQMDALERIKPAPKPVIARCYFTPDYRKDAQLCLTSFGKHGLEVHGVQLEKKKTWILTCMSRVSDLVVISELMPDRWVGCLDADLECVAKPTLLLDPPNADVLTHNRGEDLGPEHQYCAGLSFFAPTKNGRKCLQAWAKSCKEDRLAKGDDGPKVQFSTKSPPPCREQLYLKLAIESIPNLVVHDLTEAFNKKPEHSTKGDGAIVMHHVASRRHGLSIADRK
jgi:hypothetical protein